MERFRTLRIIIYFILAILIVQIGLLLWILRPSSFIVWAGFAVVFILCVYMGRVAMVLLNELIEKENNPTK